MARALWRFCRERFPLSSHVPLVAVFTLGNVALVGDAGQGARLAPARFAAVWAIGLLYFFRLRCFDELKDHEIDARINPDRPLARGLVTRRQLATAAVIALALEIRLGVALGRGTGLAVLGVAQAYSLLMLREFFLGAALRPRITAYAVTHTFSAALLGAALGILHADVNRHALEPRTIVALVSNWCLFNLFEFARKTWAPDEERQDVDSYSRRFGLPGAVLLALFQVVGGLVLASVHPRALAARSAALAAAGCALLPLAGGLLVIERRSARAAAIYRALVSIDLVLFYAGLAAVHLAPLS